MSLPEAMIAPAPDSAAHAANAGVRSGWSAKMITRSDVRTASFVYGSVSSMKSGRYSGTGNCVTSKEVFSLIVWIARSPYLPRVTTAMEIIMDDRSR